MSIITSIGHKQTAEVEFVGKHPDIFSSHLAARFVKNVAEEAEKLGHINSLKVDINVQILASEYEEDGITPVIVNIGGQITCDAEIDLKTVAKQSVIEQLETAGYLGYGTFDIDHISVNLDGITRQSPNLNKTTMRNAYADSCVSYGFHISEPYGIQGSFPSLILAQKIDSLIDTYTKEINHELRSDGKVHVTIEYLNDGFIIKDVYISIAHSKSIKEGWRDELKQYLIENINEYGIDKANFSVNNGGDFNVFFLQADSGVSKAKDDVIISGGIHQLGTDRVWGKCLYKASSTLIPYAFALSKVICDVTGAKYASVSGYSHYGQEKAYFQLQDIDAEHEKGRAKINTALENVVRDRDGVRAILEMPVSIETYRLYNDVSNFHSSDRPWKKNNKELEDIFKKAYNG